jgi:hypothetical protein
MRKKGFHLASEQEIVRDHIDLEVAFRRDPVGLCQAVGAVLNEMLRDEPLMKGWEWGLDWNNLPGAISVMVSGMACNPSQVQCPTFFAATSVVEYNEVDDAAARLKHRILCTLEGWKLPHE